MSYEFGCNGDAIWRPGNFWGVESSINSRESKEAGNLLGLLSLRWNCGLSLSRFIRFAGDSTPASAHALSFGASRKLFIVYFEVIICFLDTFKD